MPHVVYFHYLSQKPKGLKNAELNRIINQQTRHHHHLLAWASCFLPARDPSLKGVTFADPRRLTDKHTCTAFCAAKHSLTHTADLVGDLLAALVQRGVEDGELQQSQGSGLATESGLARGTQEGGVCGGWGDGGGCKSTSAGR